MVLTPRLGGINGDETDSLVGLLCTDGLYADGGFGTGRVVAAADGGDNLDFWAHDVVYRRACGGNLGDRTDPFDGVRYRRFWLRGNPSASSVGDFSPVVLAAGTGGLAG